MALAAEIVEPFPISRIADRYFLFDVDVISHVRRTHSICGVLIGTIPNLSQQNVFLGIPLQLLPEEARLLVEQGHAFIVDEVQAHKDGVIEMSRQDRLKYLQDMDEQGRERARLAQKKNDERSVKALKEKGLDPGKMLAKREAKKKGAKPSEETNGEVEYDGADEESLFDHSSHASPTPSSIKDKNIQPHFLTPTTSYPPLTIPTSQSQPLPTVPRQYPLFRYLHSKGYFQMPGIRFGCHYSVYPGDPLRFHSHFLATGLGWDEEFDMLDIVAGGRLGTTVKKACLIGGKDSASKGEEESTRAFSIEWAGL